jgi:hypothetical protein
MYCITSKCSFSKQKNKLIFCNVSQRITVIVLFLCVCMYIWGRGVQNIVKIGVYLPPYTVLATVDVLLCWYWLLDGIKGQVYKWIIFAKDLNWIMISQWGLGEYTGVGFVTKLIDFRFERRSRNIHRRYASKVLVSCFSWTVFMIVLDHSRKFPELFINYKTVTPICVKQRRILQDLPNLKNVEYIYL